MSLDPLREQEPVERVLAQRYLGTLQFAACHLSVSKWLQLLGQHQFHHHVRRALPHLAKCYEFQLLLAAYSGRGYEAWTGKSTALVSRADLTLECLALREKE